MKKTSKKDGTFVGPCGCKYTPEMARTLWGRYTNRLSSGNRLPDSERCPCGAMSKTRAKLRNHKCQ
jgi:hypothetical protein